MLIGADCYLLVGYFCLGDGGGSFSRLPPPQKKSAIVNRVFAKAEPQHPFPSRLQAEPSATEPAAFSDCKSGAPEACNPAEP